jgi:imidazolonepropionase-like amidohydrolase
MCRLLPARFDPSRRLVVWAIALMVDGVCTTESTAQASIAIRDVTVVDGSSPIPRANQTVVIRGTRIALVGPTASTPIPTGATTVEGRGRFLIPGLWDMHVHTDAPGGRDVLPLYVLNGVTGVRDMAGRWSEITRSRREIAEGSLVGPRIIASGPYIEGGDVPIPHILARTPDEARAAVDSLVALGVDFIKLHSQFRREVFFAAARRARERGIAFTGHIPRSITAIEASDSGQRSLEHLLQIPSPCTPAESLSLAPRFVVQGVLARCTSADVAPVFARLVTNGTWVVPTLVAQYEVAHWPRRDLPGDMYASYLPDTLKRYVAQIFPMPNDVPSGAEIVGEQLFEKRVAVVGTMHRAGVAMMPGTDAPLRNSPPGFGLHQELELFVRGGLSNFDALRSATLEPARYFAALDSMGTVAPGKLADLVILEANPLEDIRNARRVFAVVANGRLIGAAERSRLLRGLEQRAR